MKSEKKATLQEQILKIVNITIIVPLIISLVYTMLFFQSSFSSIFNNNIARVLDDSIKVADTYHEEYKKNILSDVKSIGATINNNFSGLVTDTEILKELLENYTNLKELSDAVVFVPSQNLILAKNDFSFGLVFDYIPSQIIEETEINNPKLLEGGNKVRALIRLNNFSYPTYLMIGRHLDEKVMSYIAETREATSSYNLLTKRVHNLQSLFLLIFVAVLVLLILTARFIAKFLSGKLTKHLGDFVNAISGISAGDLTIRANDTTLIAELDSLSSSFNGMVKELSNSRREIVNRGDFIEAILNQIPDGLMVFDNFGMVIMQNHSSKEIIERFGKEASSIFMRRVSELTNSTSTEKESTISIEGRNFLLKIATFNDETQKYLVTFTDVTEHIAYQKNLLWVEVAKRITHEIRNPLTPIILSAERLEDKFFTLCRNTNESSDFSRYIMNIKRHSEDIAIIIDEFVQFGKMPQIIIKAHNFVDLVTSAISNASFDSEILYEFTSDLERLMVECDDKQVGRVFLNLFKNSYEALKEVVEKKIIYILLKIVDKEIILTITDNGVGFPEELLPKITEPYISTKSKGSGLGLAIVKKIIDDHNWNIRFYNNKSGVIEIRLPFKPL